MSSFELRPYQAEGIDFLAERRRAALFDRPGLGKSMQSLLALNDRLGDRARILVVATGDAIGVWQDEVAKWLGEEAAVYAGTKADHKALTHQGVVICNYHRMPAAFGQHWDGYIFDESQMLRNRNTRTLFHYVRRNLPKYPPAYFLSGTPIVKHTGDIWPILHLIDHKRWRGYWDFVKKYCIVWQDQHGWHVEGVTNLRGLWQELEDVALRRTAGEVELPPKVRQRVPLLMTPRQSRAYKELDKEMMTETDEDILLLTSTVLAKETRLRQLLTCPRVLGIDDDGAAIGALATVAEQNSDPFVVFTPFAAALPYISTRLEQKGRPTYTLRGGMGEKFGETVNLFKLAAKAGEAPVLIATVQMGKSWDVSQWASDCYMVGFDWNDTTNDQAESRLHRRGQQSTVFSRYFVHEGAHDYDGLEIVTGKRRLANAILDRKTKSHRFRAGK